MHQTEHTHQSFMDRISNAVVEDDLQIALDEICWRISSTKFVLVTPSYNGEFPLLGSDLRVEGDGTRLMGSEETKALEACLYKYKQGALGVKNDDGDIEALLLDLLILANALRHHVKCPEQAAGSKPPAEVVTV